MYLENVDSPDDLKKIKKEELKYLCKEIREFLVTNIGNTGGHLSSNLGVIELTVAMHYVFNSPYDKIIFDVSHQSYTHKILTGRKNEFYKLRKEDGLSGFTNKEESKHDIFTLGHSSTSIAMASGLAVARDLKKENNKIIALIGDGALTGGLSYEALNNIGNLNTNVIVVLNDNNMSISKSVGALTKHLNNLRVNKNYYKLKKDTQITLEKIPIVGKYILKKLQHTKRYLKYTLVNTSTIFEELGFRYVGPINGHSIEELVNIFEVLKDVNGPVLLHVKTCKGKGYSYAEKNPTKFHGVGKFNLDTGRIEKKEQDTYSIVAGKTLTKLASSNKDIVVITAAMTDGTGVRPFIEKYPSRFFDVGIAEEYAVSFAAGICSYGLKPVFMVYSTFLQRAYDQILHDICLNNLGVVFLIDRAGIVGEDGKTHQGIYDISMLLSIPNLMILAPRDTKELEKMIEYSVEQNSPIAIRYPKGKSNDTHFTNYDDIKIGKFEVLNVGKDIAILGLGACFDIAERVYNNLKEKNINATLINPRFIYPIDDECIKNILQTHSYIITIEDGISDGGFGEKISNFILKNGYEDKKILNFSYPKEFIEHGKREDIMKKYGIEEVNITNKILDITNNDVEILQNYRSC